MDKKTKDSKKLNKQNNKDNNKDLNNLSMLVPGETENTVLNSKKQTIDQKQIG